jgi:hypothetical protein
MQFLTKNTKIEITSAFLQGLKIEIVNINFEFDYEFSLASISKFVIVTKNLESRIEG